MPYNLLDEPWIPVRTPASSRRWIAPHELANPDDPPLQVASGRPDFDGALTQMLIGLVQTAAAPETMAEWRRGFDRPPTDLRTAFDEYRDAFWLDGEGPRFFQDFTLKRNKAKVFPVAALLLEDANAELFARDGEVAAMGMPAVAAALLTLQTNAPSGGAGHRTSLRGGGPLSTVVVADSLWKTIWLNVLSRQEFDAGPGRASLSSPADVFPWLAATRTSGKSDPATTPDDVHPLQHYWAMPRRIRLDFGDGDLRACSLYGSRGPCVAEYYTRPHGVNYEGAFEHPLTPHTVVKPTEPPNPRKGRPGGIPYRDWPAMLWGDESIRPARVVSAYLMESRHRKAGAAQMWAFGYDMDNMKARAWYEVTSPLLVVAEEHRAAVAGHVASCVEASEDVRKTLAQQVKVAITRRPEDRKRADGTAEFASIAQAFWQGTEAGFFSVVDGLRAAIESEQSVEPELERWLRLLHEQAVRVFDGHCQGRADLIGVDIKRLARASNALRSFTSPRNNKLRKIVQLPPIKRRKRA